MRKVLLMLLLLVFSINLFSEEPPDSSMTRPDTSTRVWENPDYESVRHWVNPDTVYSGSVLDNFLGVCGNPWDAVVSKNYWLSGKDSCFKAIGNTYIIQPIVIDSTGDTGYIPLPIPWLIDTIVSLVRQDSSTFSHDTITYRFDTIIVTYDTITTVIQNGMAYADFMRYFCDSVILSIDTTTSPDDTVWCKVCDSFLVETKFLISGHDTISYQVYQTVHPPVMDTCGIFSGAGTVNIYGDIYVTNADTTIITNVYPQVTTSWWFYVNQAITGVERVNRGDTITIYSGIIIRDPNLPAPLPIRNEGIFVKECGCTSSYQQVIVDTIDALFGIDSTWKIYDTRFTLTETGDSLYYYIPPGDDPRVDRIGCFADSVYRYGGYTVKYANRGANVPWRCFQGGHGNLDGTGGETYAKNVLDSAIAVFGKNDTILFEGDSITVNQYYRCDLDTTSIIPVNYISKATDTSFAYACSTFGNDEVHSCLKIIAMRFEKAVDFRQFYSDSVIDIIEQYDPMWVISTMRDDFTPYIDINGSIFQLDSTGGRDSNYIAKTYRVQPPAWLDYHQPVKVKIGVYSCETPRIGLAAIFGLQYATTDSIDTCWARKDSIILPPCDTCNSPNFFIYGPTENQSYDTVFLCGIDTLDWYDNNIWLLDWIFDLHSEVIMYDTLESRISFISPDTLDTMGIYIYPDSSKIRNLRTSEPMIFDNPIKHKGNVLITDDSKLYVTDQSGVDSLKFIVTSDTSFISSDNYNKFVGTADTALFAKGITSAVKDTIASIIADSAHNYYDTASVNWLLDSLDSAILDTIVNKIGCQCDFDDTTYYITTNYLDQDSFQVCSLSTGKGFLTEMWVYNDSFNGILDISSTVSIEVLNTYPYTANLFQTVTQPFAVPTTLNNGYYHSSLNDTIVYSSVPLPTGKNIILREDSDSVYHIKSSAGTTSVLYESLVNPKTNGSPIFSVMSMGIYYTPIYNNKLYLRVTNNTTGARDYIIRVKIRRIR